MYRMHRQAMIRVVFALTALVTGHLYASPMTLKWTSLPSLPDPEGFAGCYAGVSGDALLVAGGANFPGKRPWEGGTKIWYDSVFVLVQPAGVWRVAGKLPRPLAYGVAITARLGLVCAGGGDPARHVRDVILLRWDGTRLTETRLPPLPAPSAFGSGALVGDDFYLAGGIERPDSVTAQSTLWRLRLNEPAPEWETLCPCPGPARMLAQAGAFAGRLYLCGGVSLTAGPDGKPVRTYLKDAYAFDRTEGWKRLADLPHPVAGAPSPMPVSGDGLFAVISGDDGSRVALAGANHPGFLREVLLYDARRDVWSVGNETAPISRATAPTTLWGNRWLIVSGERKPGYRSPEVWAVELSP